MSKKICFFIFLLFCPFFGAEGKQTVCLNMIVKNESRVMQRCLDSVLPVIDYWVIVDTGSEDGTQGIIQDYMDEKQIPGELHERPWINFAHNRNEALQLAKGKCDYILFIDADEVLVYEPGFELPDLNKDFYHVMTDFGGTVYARVQFIKDSLDWKWVGVLHEAIMCPQAVSSEVMKGVQNHPYTDGARSQDPDKYKKDAAVLEKALESEPYNTRYMFYLAQSYKDAGDYEKSIEAYQRRINMGGWNEEVFWSKLQVAILKNVLEYPFDEVLEAFSSTYSYRSSRIEPLYYMAHLCRLKKEYALGYIFASLAAKIPPSKDLLFVQKWMYDYGALLEFSICAYWIGRYAECASISRQILSEPSLPQNIRECVERNLAFAEEKMQSVGL